MSIRSPGFSVQDAGGGEWSGLWVYTGSAEVTVSQGDVVDIVGTTTEYYGLTEVMVEAAEDVSVMSSGADVAVMSLSEIPADWEPYEGVVITLPDVTMTGEADSGGEPMTNWGIAIEDLFMDLDADPMSAAYSSVTGVLTYNWDTYKIAPRSAADLVE